MISLSKLSKLSGEEVLKKAVEFFGPEGYGLETREETSDHISFEGGGGHVTVAANPDGRKTSVEVTSREWDRQAKEFIMSLN